MKAVCLAAFLFAQTAAWAGQFVVVIDPGHGGSQDVGTQPERSLSAANNAVAPSGLKEKDLTLELSLEIRAQLKALAGRDGNQVECRLTRTDDRNLDFIKRAEVCAGPPVPSAIVSLHFNASSGKKGLGTLTVIHNKAVNPNYRADYAFATGLTKATNAAVQKYVPASKVRLPIADSYLHGGQGSNFFYQLKRNHALAKVPKCFLEVEFIDRADVEKSLLDHRKTAFPILAKAIAEFLYTQSK